MNSRLHQTGAAMDYTAGSNITAGKLIKLAGLVGMAINDIASGAVGALQIEGVAAIKKADETIIAGLPVWWDDNGNPKVGTPGTGCATSLGGAGMAAADLLIGQAVYDAAAADEWVYVALNTFSPGYPAWPNRKHKADVTGTVDNTDGGMVLRIATADQTITLPAIATTAIGIEVIIILDTADGAGETGLKVLVDAADGFSGHGLTHALDHYLINAAATSKRGDYLRLLSAGDTHWQVLEKRGVWTLVDQET